MKHVAYRLSMWLLRHSGDAGADAWRQLREKAEQAADDAARARHERWQAVKALLSFREAVQRADSMISAGMPEKAQQTIRVALIASRDVNHTVKLPMPSHGMSSIHL